VLRRLGLNKPSALELEPVRRYEREHPGGLIHIDIKKLGRIGGVGHGSIGARPPINRLGLSEDNLLRLHSLLEPMTWQPGFD
jgi:hypothetical protein